MGWTQRKHLYIMQFIEHATKSIISLLRSLSFGGVGAIQSLTSMLFLEDADVAVL